MTEPPVDTPAPPPQSAPPGAQPPKRKSVTPMIILIVVGALTVCCGLAITGGFLLFRAGSQAIGPIRDAGDAFLADLEEGDYPHAYAQLCASTKAQYSEERFKSIASAHRIKSYSITKVNVMNVNGRTSGSVTAELQYADGYPETRTILLAKNGSTWQVCGQPY